MKIKKLQVGSLATRQPLVMLHEDSEALDRATVRGWSAYMTMGFSIANVKPCVTTHITPEMGAELEQRAQKKGVTIQELFDKWDKDHGNRVRPATARPDQSRAAARLDNDRVCPDRIRTRGHGVRPLAAGDAMNTGPRAATRFQLDALRALVDGQEVAYGVTLHSLIKRRLVERGRGNEKYDSAWAKVE